MSVDRARRCSTPRPSAPIRPSPTVTDLTALNATTQAAQNLSSLGSGAFSAGPSVPIFDPQLIFTGGYLRRSDTVTLGASTTGASGAGGVGTGAATTTTHHPAHPLHRRQRGLSAGILHGSAAHCARQQRPAGALRQQLEQQSVLAAQHLRHPDASRCCAAADAPSTCAICTSHRPTRRISRLLFEQQVLQTTYGVSRIYYDLVSLGENVQVKQEALRSAEKLRRDDADQVIEGTLAPVELTRAAALVSSSEFDLVQAQGLYRQQEVILRNQILRTESNVFNAAFTEIVPTDHITVPEVLDDQPIDDLVAQGLAHRPDLAQAELQVKTGQISVDAARNNALTQLNVYANVQTRGANEQNYDTLGTPGTGIVTIPSALATGGLRTSTIYQAGVQVTLPLRNRVCSGRRRARCHPAPSGRSPYGKAWSLNPAAG